MDTRTMGMPAAGGLLLTVVALALFLIFSGNVGGSGTGGTSAAHAGCGSLKAEVVAVSSFPKPFANQYKKKLKIQVNGGQGARKWRAELYTFSGFLLGKSKTDKKLSSGETAKIKLKQAMQPGPYTIVVKGKVGGCGEKELAEVLRFRDCLTKLPITFIDRPRGQAADYNSGGFVSAKIAPKSAWAPIKKVKSTLADFDGVVYGQAELDAKRLIGEQFLNNELTRNLVPGKYSLFVEGKAPQPRSCGEKSKTAILRFK